MELLKNRKRIVFTVFSLILLLVVVTGGIAVILNLNNKTSSSHAKQAPTSTTDTVEPLFIDHFSDNSKGWSVGNVGGYTRAVNDNMLLLADTKHNVLVESVPTPRTFADFSITTTFTLLQADANDSVGLYVRGDSNLDHDYRIDIFGNAHYAISKETLNAKNDLDQTYLVRPTSSSILKPIGQKNTLTVTMQGSLMVMQMNGKTMRKLNDTGYTRGQIALFVSNGATSSGVKAAFHDLMIYPLTNALSASQTCYRYWLVSECFAPSSSRGVPSKMTMPPLLPPSGPISMIQSALRITSKWCSITITVFPPSTSRFMMVSRRPMSERCRPVVGSSMT